MDEVLVGSDRAVKYAAVDDDGNKVEGAAGTCILIDPTGAETTPSVTSTGNVYKAICRSALKGTWKAVITVTSGSHIGRAKDEWRARDPKETP